jgi:hypothetical protein
VKPETALFLEKAHEPLGRAKVMTGAGLHEDAGRAAYLAGFHAAQALIFEHRNGIVKTQCGRNFSVSPRVMRALIRNFAPFSAAPTISSML